MLLASDDLFSLKKGPGKTLVVGAGYVALEVHRARARHHPTTSMSVLQLFAVVGSLDGQPLPNPFSPMAPSALPPHQPPPPPHHMSSVQASSPA